MRLLEKVRYSDGDRLIVCGDLLDKGKDSVRLMKTVFDLPGAYCIKGNHEHTFFLFYRTRMHSAVQDLDAILWHLQQYFEGDGHLLDWETVDILVDLPYYLEERDFVCVHAGAPLDGAGRLLPLDEASPEELVNDRRFKEPTVLPKDGRCVFFGHTPTQYLSGKPQILTYLREGARGDRVSDYAKIHLDTGTTLSGVLGCFCVETCETFYVTK